MRPAIPPIDDDLTCFVVRTDYTDDATWRTVTEMIDAVPPEYGQQTSGLEFVVLVDDPVWDGANADEVLAAMSDNGGGVVFLADAATMRDPHPLLAVNTVTREQCVEDEQYEYEMKYGREFRLLPVGVYDVISNVTISNMDFPEFAAWARRSPSEIFPGSFDDHA
jgi:hypothetical protein